MLDTYSALQDAYVLAGLLGHLSTTVDTLSRALEVYDQIRRPFANSIVDGSRLSGIMYEFNSVHGENYEVLGPAIERQWDWVRSPDPVQQLDEALSCLASDQRGEEGSYYKL